MSTPALLSADGRPIRCPADEHVKRAAQLAVGERFIDRAEDLRSRGITPCVVLEHTPTGGVIAKPEAFDAKWEWAADDWVVSFPR